MTAGHIGYSYTLLRKHTLRNTKTPKQVYSCFFSQRQIFIIPKQTQNNGNYLFQFLEVPVYDSH